MISTIKRLAAAKRTTSTVFLRLYSRSADENVELTIKVYFSTLKLDSVHLPTVNYVLTSRVLPQNELKYINSFVVWSSIKDRYLV